ncbi:MAG TPA: polysaccharide deacetylase family protein [Solirubrobacteraceae bacterium]|nr:polysaccharide deacetylase family protein [Solirubrobacteraceae bacterium]
MQVRHRAGATVSLTFDNLGEVADLERGKWPADAPLGRHASVTRTLPRILSLLQDAGVRATFFVEGLNAELYPDALRSIADAGHEVAYHGWQHEPWADLSPDDERASLERGVAALDALGLRPVGFRPPGGRLTAASSALLLELGFEYVSPEEGETADGLEVRPFRWPLVDALYYLPHFADLRERYLGTREEQPPERLREAIAAARDEILVFHPFLLDDDERFATLRFAASVRDSDDQRS